MIVLVQRVASASVTVDGRTVGAIGRGLLVFLGVHRLDEGSEVAYLARKCLNLRIFSDDAGLMNRSVVDVGGEVLVVSQFTLCGTAKKGNRPSFVDAARPEKAEALYLRFIAAMEAGLDKSVAAGVFGASMQVRLVNDGPVTLWIERKPEGATRAEMPR